ncbi:MAG: SEC-C domain-containing protein, partial [Gammaproteobacteria bacterium]|nr:SEC-C domain-containing protein [Gammaproteobacteria bacterium]
KSLLLQILDQIWKEHLAAMDYLRQGIHLRGYAQKNPKQEYKREAFEMFSELLERFKFEVIGFISKIQVRAEQDVQQVEEQRRHTAPVNLIHEDSTAMALEEAPAEEFAVAAGGGARGAVAAAGAVVTDGGAPFVREGRKIGRNEPCPCGSGKKFKQCHGKL